MLRPIIASCLTALAAQAFAVPLVNNPSSLVVNGPSRIPITVDGQFSGGVVGGQIVGEWSDVTPLAFIAPSSETGTLFRARRDDSRVNSLLYAVIAPGDAALNDELYLMYDYMGRTIPTFAPGEFIADVTFAVDLSQRGGSSNQTIRVQFRGASPLVSAAPVHSAATSFFDVFVDLNNDGTSDALASAFGIDGAVGFGPSSLSSVAHLLVELEVPLKIPAGFGSAFPIGGLPGGIYSPDPKFWGAGASKDVGDPPISAAIFQINPNGSTTASSSEAGVPLAPNQVPEPATPALLGAALVAWLLRKKAG